LHTRGTFIYAIMTFFLPSHVIPVIKLSDGPKAGIVGYGVYIPWCRIKLSDIAEAWKLPMKPPGEKTVPYYDEDAVTMAVEAALNAIKHAKIDGSELGAVYVGTTSSPYLEKQVSTIIAEVVGASASAQRIDFTGSARASTAALIACVNAIRSGEVNYGLVIGTDVLVPPPGDREGMEFTMSAGAAALVLGKDNIIAEIEGFATYSTDFTERWKNVEDQVPRVSLSRFSREFGYIMHVEKACKSLYEKLNLKPSDFKYAVFTEPPDPRGYLMRLAPKIGLTPAHIMAGMMPIAQFIGDCGCASVLIALAAVLDMAKPRERILMASYGSGCSDAFSIKVTDAIEAKRQKIVNTYINKKTYIDYPTYLRFLKLYQMMYGMR